MCDGGRNIVLNQFIGKGPSLVFQFLLTDKDAHDKRVGQQFGRRVRRLCNESGHHVIALFLHGGEGLFDNESGIVHAVEVRDHALLVGAVKKGGLRPVGADGEHADPARAQFLIDGT